MGAPSQGSWLVADIGGTNARFARVGRDGSLEDVRSLRVAGHASPQAAIAAYLEATGSAPLTAAAIAVAGPVLADGAALTNGTWAFKTASLSRELGLEHVFVLNDFEALALCLPQLGAHDVMQIGGGLPAMEAPKVVLGPGTGFGGAALLPAPSFRVLSSEIGHTSLPTMGEDEGRVAEALADSDGHIPVENAVSGPGLIALYRHYARLEQNAPALDDPASIVEAARYHQQPAAGRAVALFITWLGRVASNAALLYRADGGVYIGGGIAPKMRDLLADGRLRHAFDSKGRMSSLVTGVPLYVITADEPGLRGAAAHLHRTLGPAVLT